MIKMFEVNQKEFEEIIKKNTEKIVNNKTLRGSIWNSCRNLLKDNYEYEAYILLLSTWNFARFRYAMTSFNEDEFRKLIKRNEKIFKKLDKLKFETVNFNDPILKEDIKSIYSSYRKIEGIEQTGTTKLMALRNPNLFVMWDVEIRKSYKINDKGTSEDYIEYLNKLKETFKDIKWDNKDKPFAKAIDEYNYYKVHSTIE